MTLETPKERDLFYTQDFNEQSVSTLTKEILEINKSDDYLVKLYALHGIIYYPKPIKIYIDSYGGNIYQGLGLFSVMDKSETPIHTIVTGCAMSCGFLMSLHGKRRFAMKHSTFMYHQGWSSGKGKFKDLKESCIENDRLHDVITKIVVDKTNISAEKLEENYKQKQDWYMSADEALKLGVIDDII